MAGNLLKYLRGSRRFAGDKKGASAIEFAIVAPVFFALMFSTFEVGWFYFVNATMDAATVNVARYIRTGQAHVNGYSGSDSKDDFFADVVCPKVDFLVDCQNRITAEVQTFNSFAELAADNTPITCTDNSSDEIDAIPYNPGNDNAIVRVRICLIYDTLNPAIGLNLAKNDQGQRKITTSYILRVEPYSKNVKQSSVPSS